MHKEAVHFIKFVASTFINYFFDKIVLDVGGGDINGNNRNIFTNCTYICNDVCPSENVNCVSRTKDVPFEDYYFDTIVSTECFEHDPEYTESFLKIYNILKPGGLFAFTCASTDRKEHGTRNSKPHQSYGTISDIEDMRDYYKNLTVIELNEVLPLNDLFIIWKSYYNHFSKDLYFVGIKKGETDKEIMELYEKIQYIETNVIETTNDIPL